LNPDDRAYKEPLHNLVRVEPVAGLNEPPQISVKLFARDEPVDRSRIDIDLRIIIEKCDHFVQERPSGDLSPKAGDN
jgi:hypothetical protein